MFQNLHMHTARCKHATGTEREYIETAIAAGFTDIGFSDHSPLPADWLRRYPDPARVRMDMRQLDEYAATVRKLADEYRDDITIRLGIELEYLPEIHHQTVRDLRSAGIEYLLLGEHFLDGGAYWSGQPTDDPYKLEKYTGLVLEGAATGDFVLAAHPDLINYADRNSDLYLSQMTLLCDELGKMRVPLEINLYGIYDHRCYPNEQFWTIAAENGNTAVISTDAHRPERMNDTVSLLKAKEMIARLGIHTVDSIL